MYRVIDVVGMNCEHCRKAVEMALAEVPGVGEVNVDLNKKTAYVKLDFDVDDGTLMAAVDDAGFEAVSVRRAESA